MREYKRASLFDGDDTRSVAEESEGRRCGGGGGGGGGSGGGEWWFIAQPNRFDVADEAVEVDST